MLPRGSRFAAACPAVAFGEGGWKNGLSSACADGDVGGWLDPHDEPFIGWAPRGSVRGWRISAADAWTASEAVFVLARVTRLKVARGPGMPTAYGHGGERPGALTFLTAFLRGPRRRRVQGMLPRARPLSGVIAGRP